MMEDEREQRLRGRIVKIEPMFPRRPPRKPVSGGPQVTLSTAMNTVVTRNRLDDAEAASFRRCLRRALNEMAADDLEKRSKRLKGRQRFIGILANNHLAIRAPACSNRGRRHRSSDIMLAWPNDVRPSVLSASRFRPGGGFKLVPDIMNLYLTWDECDGLNEGDWRAFREACHKLLTPPTRRWPSNIILPASLTGRSNKPGTLVRVLEGKRKEVRLTKVERKKELRELALLDRGCLCQICSFDVGDVYGDFAKMCVEVHHLNPLAGAGTRGVSVSLDDLIVVCPNCHRALHQFKDPADWKAFQKECDLP